MKMLRFTLLPLMGILCMFTMSAQNDGPAPSPKCKVKQTVGFTEVTMVYSRPGVKERDIYGGLVPYDKVWRTGANAATKIAFSTDVTLGGVAIPAGDYALLTKPGKEQWEWHFYPHEEDARWASYTEGDKKSYKVMVKPFEIDSNIESMMIFIDNLRDTSAELYILWDNVYVGATLEVPSNAPMAKEN